jgi:hypothetical protein
MICFAGSPCRVHTVQQHGKQGLRSMYVLTPAACLCTAHSTRPHQLLTPNRSSRISYEQLSCNSSVWQYLQSNRYTEWPIGQLWLRMYAVCPCNRMTDVDQPRIHTFLPRKKDVYSQMFVRSSGPKKKYRMKVHIHTNGRSGHHIYGHTGTLSGFRYACQFMTLQWTTNQTRILHIIDRSLYK